MPYTDSIVIGNSGAGTDDGATASISPAFPSIASNGHVGLSNGTGTAAVAANDSLLFGTKFTFDPIYGNSNMFLFPVSNTSGLIVEYAIISSDESTELYTDVVNYTSGSKNMIAGSSIYNMIIVPKRKPLRIVVS